MKRGTLRLVDAKRSPMPGAEPGIADVLAHPWGPASLLQLLEGIRVSREWLPLGDGYARCPAVVVTRTVGALDLVEPDAYVWLSPDDHRWHVEVLGVPLSETYSDSTVARLAADSGLTKVGHALIGNPR